MTCEDIILLILLWIALFCFLNVLPDILYDIFHRR
jgi:hypothetical protein